MIWKNLKPGIKPYKTSNTFTTRYRVKPHATNAWINPTIGLVLNNVFWDRKAHKPSRQFLRTSFQTIGLEPILITLYIRPKVMYATPRQLVVKIRKAIFSIKDNNKSSYKFS
jgi:hypothetical protein